MQQCPQTDTQSVWQHGLSVKDHVFQLIDFLNTGNIQGQWKLPEWMYQYRQQLLDRLLPLPIIKEYAIFHDCGKPYCFQLDEQGKRHFPNHPQQSYQTWLSISDNKQIAALILMDMKIHTIKAVEIEEFIKQPEAITLLLAGLAEVHSNAKMFGGLESESFKIKWSQINKRGKMICQKLFKNKTIFCTQSHQS